MDRTKHGIVTVILVLVIALCLIPAVDAVPPLPCEYRGLVTIDGAAAPAGTVIVAKINGAVRGQVTTGAGGVLGGLSTFDSRLVVSATETDIDLTPNPTVNFTVNGVCTNSFAAAPFYSGETRYVTLNSRAAKTLPGYTLKPTDPDGDGIYEDLNGNGRLDFADVVLYFNQMEWIAANEPVCAFDLNNNGRIDFADIVKLFGEI